MASLAASTIHHIARVSGLHHVVRRAQRRRLLIVCYHGLREDDDPARHWLLLPRSAFEAQIRHLAAHYDCLPIDTALQRLWAGEIDTPTACVTFDDGYRNNFEIGLPVLRRHQVPATIYLATGLIGTADLLWTTTLELAFRRARADSVDLTTLGFGRVALGDDAARAATGSRVVETLKTRAAGERLDLVGALMEQLDEERRAADRAPFELMNWREVSDLATSKLVTFGAHTVSHEIVSRLDDDALEREIAGSVDSVARAVPDARSATFAYPNGRSQDVDARAAAVLAHAGCSAAVTTTEGLNDAATPRMGLRRAVVGGNATLNGFVSQATALRRFVER
jgi:peptidoglycan/xylan/chitin deacetylase (PgdA/CDA1 family)